MTEPTPSPPPSPAVQGPPPGGPSPKKKSPWLWIGLGCGLLVLGAILVMVISGMWVARQAQDVLENPAVAAARVIAATNPEIGLEEVDRDRQRITFRNNETGERLTVSFEDVEQGRIRFESDEGEMVFGLDEETEDIPAWVPSYPDVAIEGHFSMRRNGQRSGQFGFSTPDSVDRVIERYTTALQGQGFTVTSQAFRQDDRIVSAVLSAQHEERGRSVTVILSSEPDKTEVSVSYDGPS